MHLIRRVGLFVAILTLVSGGAAVAGKPRFVWDAGSVGGRDVFSMGGARKKIHRRTSRTDADATLMTASPDGKRILWQLTPQGTTGRSDLVVARAVKGKGRVVTADLSGRVIDAAFTGNSKHLLFLFEDAATRRTHLYRVNAKGKGLRSPTLGLPGNATGILATSPHDAAAVLEWSFISHDGLLLVDPVKNLATVLDLGLPDGDAGSYAGFPEPGVLHFTWRPDGAELEDLWQLDDRSLTRIASGVRSPRAYGTSTLAVVPGEPDDELLLISVLWETRVPVPGKVVGLCRTTPPGPPVAAVEGPEGLRVYQFAWSAAPPIDLVPNREIEAVEEMLAVPPGSVLVALREAGTRRLLLTNSVRVQLIGDDWPLDPAGDLTGTVGAFRTVTPDGQFIFSHLAPGGATGELYVRPGAFGPIALISRTGLTGLPGRAVVSAATSDVLFNVITMPEADNRLFLWDRKRDEVRPLSTPGTRPGTFLITR